MITVEQIKAARALLNWNQQDLATAARMSKPALANLERRTVKPRTKTLDAIKYALEEAGVVFTDGPGVELNSDELKVQVWDGGDAISRIWSDMLSSLEDGDTCIVTGLDETIYKEIAGMDRYHKHISKLNKRNIRSLIFTREGDKNYTEKTGNYRWLPEEYFPDIPLYIYADKYAILLWDPYPKVILIRNKPIADNYRKYYMRLWKDAKMPTDYEDRFSIEE